MKRIIIILMLIVMILDFGFTLLGQPDKYWGGDYQFTNERFPVANFLLSVHPAAFIGFFILWIALAICAVRILRPPWVFIFGIAVILAHFWGSILWIPRLCASFRPDWLTGGEWSFYSPMIYIILLATTFGLIIYKLGLKNK